MAFIKTSFLKYVGVKIKEDEEGEEGEGKAHDIFNMNLDNINIDTIDAYEEYFKEMMQYMREIGVKIPITGTNWHASIEGTANTATHKNCDFCDGHQ